MHAGAGKIIRFISGKSIVVFYCSKDKLSNLFQKLSYALM